MCQRQNKLQGRLDKSDSVVLKVPTPVQLKISHCIIVEIACPILEFGFKRTRGEKANGLKNVND